MKIGIVTLISNDNNGNRLQNYALQQAIKNIFPEAQIETINLKYYKGIYQTCRYFAKSIIKKMLNLTPPSYKNFTKFNQNINFTAKKYHEDSDFDKLANDYDFVITGSDQVWNMGYYNNEKYYFLDWLPTQKKLSYSASIGNNNLSPLCQAKFKTLLKTFKYISVREKQSEDMLKNIGVNNVSTHIDPTLILTKDEWSKLAIKPKYDFKRQYIFVCLLGTMTDEYKQKIDAIASKYNLEIINLYDKANKAIYSSGPSQFIWLIKNAKLVVTDSFHSIVFSIINNVPFVHFNRQTNSNTPSANINSRIENLEHLFNTTFTNENSLDINNKDIFKLKIENPEHVLENERVRTYEYLKNAMTISVPTNLNDATFNCTGCGLCANICPHKAIEIVKNEKGFYEFNIDPNKCTRCGLCYKLCPANKIYPQYDFKKGGIFGIKSHKPIQDNSSSAGVFGQLATCTIQSGGVVYGLKYSATNEFVRVDNIDDLEQIKGSKYFQANISTIYPLIEKDLKDNKQVLVCSTPCQTAGLKQKFARFDNLTLVSIICHGTPSKDTLDKYCKETYNEPAQYINFRKKNPYWKNYYIEFQLSNDSVLEKAYTNLWFKNFLENIYLNNCCYKCNFAGNQFGADIILGDFWGIEQIDSKFYDPYGTSILICQTLKGQQLFDKICNNFVYKEYNCYEKIIKANPCLRSTNYEISKKYAHELFYINDKNNMSFNDNVNNVNQTLAKPKQPIIKRAIRKIKGIIFK